MNDKNDGGPAFPLSTPPHCADHHGMTLRDWFAGQALFNPRTWPDGSGFGTPDEIAFQAYAVADAMLAARETDHD